MNDHNRLINVRNSHKDDCLYQFFALQNFISGLKSLNVHVCAPVDVDLEEGCGLRERVQQGYGISMWQN